MRPIDADELKNNRKGYVVRIDKYTGTWPCVLLAEIADARTLDYKELAPQGKWIYHECVSSHDGTKSGYSCSLCSAFVDEDIFDSDEFHKAFCGNCGAKMEEERRIE